MKKLNNKIPVNINEFSRTIAIIIVGVIFIIYFFVTT
jgi:hypothetical protein